MTDKRKDPKPRRYPKLWQSYLYFAELQRIKVAHQNRISSIKAGKSNLDLEFEEYCLERLDLLNKYEEARQEMIEYGQDVGDVWYWVTSIKGLGTGGLAAQLLAQIDDIRIPQTPSALIRYAGYSVVNGKAERCKPGELAPFNRRLKGICWNIGTSFIRQRTEVYRDIYDEEKIRQRIKHPNRETYEVKQRGKVVTKTRYNDGHIDNMARRKMVKIFLQHLWLIWRKTEGLPTRSPYVEEYLGHNKIIPPPNEHLVI